MRRLRREQVEEEIEIVENRLRDHDQTAFEQARLGDLNECHQVHAFILCFVEQFLDPALIVAHPADGA